MNLIFAPTIPVVVGGYCALKSLDSISPQSSSSSLFSCFRVTDHLSALIWSPFFVLGLAGVNIESQSIPLFLCFYIYGGMFNAVLVWTASVARSPHSSSSVGWSTCHFCSFMTCSVSLFDVVKSPQSSSSPSSIFSTFWAVLSWNSFTLVDCCFYGVSCTDSKRSSKSIFSKNILYS